MMGSGVSPAAGGEFCRATLYPNLLVARRRACHRQSDSKFCHTESSASSRSPLVFMLTLSHNALS